MSPRPIGTAAATISREAPRGGIQANSNVIPSAPAAFGSIYLDFQASTPLDPKVLDAMLPWLRIGGNPHAAENAPGRAAHSAIERARAQVADAIGADPADVVFTSGATEGANIVLRSSAGRGHHVLASAIEHPCVADTLAVLAAAGTRTTVVPVGEDGLIDVDLLADAVQAGATLVSVMAVNNEVGTIQPLAEIAAICRASGCALHTDAAQALGRIPLDLGARRIDYATISGHKAYGPQGIGALYVAPGRMRALVPLATGGGQESGLRPGTLPTALCVGFGEACAIAAERMAADGRHAAAMSARFLARLSASGCDAVVNGSVEARVPHNLNIAIAGAGAMELLAGVPGLALSTGSACSSGSMLASRVLTAMGVAEGVKDRSFRVGFGRTTTSDDIDAAADLIAAAVRRLRAGGRATMPVMG